ncbi:MAG: hypothetical protein IJL43_00835, partial [Lachnospiraceae bacterium]|nr:hypothetical protein [Lachnospiraceae bacterium]
SSDEEGAGSDADPGSEGCTSEDGCMGSVSASPAVLPAGISVSFVLVEVSGFGTADEAAGEGEADEASRPAQP